MSKLSSPLNDPRVLLARLSRLTSTLPGLDASLMLAQYSTPIVVALLLRLARLRGQYSASGKAPALSGLVRLAQGWAKAGGSIGEARVIMRAFGLLPMVQWLLALHPNPLKSLTSMFSLTRSPFLLLNNPKTLPTLQVLSLLAYYPLEHLAWLAGKGVVPLSPRNAGMASLWSVRFWALYVLLELFKLRQTYASLVKRTRQVKSAKPDIQPSEAEGYELRETASASAPGITPEAAGAAKKAQVAELRKEWDTWQNAVVINSGYAPLTVHWSTPGGLWTSPLVTAGFGTMAALGQWTKQWRATAA